MCNWEEIFTTTNRFYTFLGMVVVSAGIVIYIMHSNNENTV